MANDKLDLETLPPETRFRVERALRPVKRDRALSLKFAKADVLAWENTAAITGENLTEWMERVLNARAGR